MPNAGPKIDYCLKTNDEILIFKVLLKANLTEYFQLFLSCGADNIDQLCDADTEEFLEIMCLIGMALKPLHVRRLQKTLQEFCSNPGIPLFFYALETIESISLPDNVSVQTIPLNTKIEFINTSDMVDQEYSSFEPQQNLSNIANNDQNKNVTNTLDSILNSSAIQNTLMELGLDLLTNPKLPNKIQNCDVHNSTPNAITVPNSKNPSQSTPHGRRQKNVLQSEENLLKEQNQHEQLLPDTFPQHSSGLELIRTCRLQKQEEKKSLAPNSDNKNAPSALKSTVIRSPSLNCDDNSNSNNPITYINGQINDINGNSAIGENSERVDTLNDFSNNGGGHDSELFNTALEGPKANKIGSSTARKYKYSNSFAPITPLERRKIREKVFEIIDTLEPLNAKRPTARRPRDKNIEELLLTADDRTEEWRNRVSVYGAIYGRFDSKRGERPLLHHELLMNEASIQVCLYRPEYLTRRDELYPLARKIVHQIGYYNERKRKSIARKERQNSKPYSAFYRNDTRCSALLSNTINNSSILDNDVLKNGGGTQKLSLLQHLATRQGSNTNNSIRYSNPKVINENKTNKTKNVILTTELTPSDILQNICNSENIFSPSTVETTNLSDSNINNSAFINITESKQNELTNGVVDDNVNIISTILPPTQTSIYNHFMNDRNNIEFNNHHNMNNATNLDDICSTTANINNYETHLIF